MVFSPLADESKLHIIHCGIDPQAVSQDLSEQSLAAVSQRLLYVGRLAAAKGLPVLLQSLAVLRLTSPDIQLTVIGDGKDRAELESQVRKAWA